MIKNEKIKASEVRLTGINGEDLGIVPTVEALALAKQLRVDLVCDSLMQSPPPCRLIGAGAVRQEAQQARREGRESKLKEIRLTPSIEDHDYETKRNQALKLLQGGDRVLLNVKLTGKEGARAKALLEELLRDLKEAGWAKTGIAVSGKQAQVEVVPLGGGQ
ncbi:translation initiation factor IF-3 [Paenibacillus sp. CAA11]|uniref:translation initiation factor IF-3 n=1 Tax=Paenibacillus sp. CAA11 TaxID=1532905 RepID=UPI000D3D078E|nr:translation initiation factor IF-3 [Paenibacillus sp. CAA11]AWB47083.1 translation initiation factor IF-3 [Paenibacillus sp. CAA11]